MFSFSERTVRSLMTPRTLIVAVDISTPFEDVLQTMIESGRSRLPVYEGTPDRIVGSLYVEDLLRAWVRPGAADLRVLLRQPIYILESQRAVVALQQLIQCQNTLALVFDEYGQVVGLIEIEDLLEGLVSELAGECDQVMEAMVRREDGSYLVNGLLPVTGLQECLRMSGVDELARKYKFETAAGLLLTLLGRIPAPGDTARWQGYTCKVVAMDKRRIDKILIHPPETCRRELAGTNKPGLGWRAVRRSRCRSPPGKTARNGPPLSGSRALDGSGTARSVDYTSSWPIIRRR